MQSLMYNAEQSRQQQTLQQWQPQGMQQGYQQPPRLMAVQVACCSRATIYTLTQAHQDLTKALEQGHQSVPLNNHGPQPQSNGQLLAASAGGAVQSSALILSSS